MIAKKEETRKISISEFKARCTEEIRTLEETGEVIEITRHGKTVARVISTEAAKTPEEWLGCCEGLVEFNGDPEALVEPTWSDDEWNMSRDDVDLDGEPTRQDSESTPK